MEIIEFVGYFGSLCLAIGFIPQAFKTWKKKSVQDISLPTYLILIMGSFSFIIYGWVYQAIPVLLANVMIASVQLFILFLYFKYKI